MLRFSERQINKTEELTIFTNQQMALWVSDLRFFTWNVTEYSANLSLRLADDAIYIVV